MKSSNIFNKKIFAGILSIAMSVMFGIWLYNSFSIEQTELFPVLTAIIFITLYKIVLKNEKKSKNIDYISILIAIYIAFTSYVGKCAWKNDNSDFINCKNMFIVFSGFPALYFYFRYIFVSSIDIFYNNKTKQVRIINKTSILYKYIWVLSTIFLLLCWIPALICNYPGIIISDYTWQYWQATGECQLNNHHPVIHTLLISLSNKIAKIVFGIESAEKTVLANSVIQSVLLSSCISYVISSFVKRNNINIKTGIAIFCFFAFFPLYGIFSVYMTKDVIFSAAVMWFSYELYSFFQKNESVALSLHKDKGYNLFELVPVFLSGVMVILFRNNGFLIVICSIGCLAVMKKYDKGCMMLIIFTVIVLVLQTSMFDVFEIPETELVESLGKPINQIANVVAHDRELTEEQIDLIEDVMPIDEIKDTYNIRYSDPLKFSSFFNSSAIENNKFDYFKLWLSLLFKYPKDYLESSLNLNIGFWYAGVYKGCISYDYDARAEYYEQLGIDHYSTNELYKTFMSSEIREKLLWGWMWSPGFAVLSMLFLLGITIVNGLKNEIMLFIPSVLGWISILIATPSYCETRYIYFIYLMIPVWIMIFFRREDRHG